MMTFPRFPESSGHASGRRDLRSERYTFDVGGKHYTLQFWPMTHLEGYDDSHLAVLGATAAYEVSFRLEDYMLPDGTILSGYDTMGTGTAFQVLGGVANGIVDWAEQRQPAFLYWQAQGTRRQRLYDRMIRSFATRGRGWYRLGLDPFTRAPLSRGTFWLKR